MRVEYRFSIREWGRIANPGQKDRASELENHYGNRTQERQFLA